jgi:hypothetical protein
VLAEHGSGFEAVSKSRADMVVATPTDGYRVLAVLPRHDFVRAESPVRSALMRELYHRPFHRWSGWSDTSVLVNRARSPLGVRWRGSSIPVALRQPSYSTMGNRPEAWDDSGRHLPTFPRGARVSMAFHGRGMLREFSLNIKRFFSHAVANP